MTYYHSATRTRQFRSCPRDWFLDNIVKRRVEKTEAQKRGSATHKELEIYFSGGPAPTDPRACAIITVWPSPAGQQQGGYQTEVSISGWYGDRPYTGQIDLIKIDSAGVVIGDFKTVYNKKAVPSSLNEDLQANRYLHWAQGTYTGEVWARWTYVFPVDKERTRFGVTCLELDTVNHDVLCAAAQTEQDIDTAVKTGDLAMFPQNRKSCWLYGRCKHFAECWQLKEPEWIQTREEYKRYLEVVK